MRRDHAILPIAIMFFGSFFIIGECFSQILISAVQTGGASTTDEYVELYNPGSTTLSLANWSLKKMTSGGTVSNLVGVFPNSAKISPFSYFLVAHRDYSCVEGVSPDQLYTTASASLAANNSLLLYSDLSNLADRVDWGLVSSTTGTPSPNPAQGMHLVRMPNDETGNGFDTDDSSRDFFESASAPRNTLSAPRPVFESIVTSTSEGISTSTPDPGDTANDSNQNISTDWSSITINEVVPNPETGDEWIELYNSSSETIDLSGGKLCDNHSADLCTIYLFTDDTIPPGWKTFYLTGSKLNNDGDSVILIAADGTTIDRLDYASPNIPIKGQSIARTDNNVEEWKISTTPTPDEKNIITEPPSPAPTPIATVSSGGGFWSAPLETNKISSKNLPTEQKINLLWNVSIPKTIRMNSTTYFDAHLTADPRGGDILYSWNFGDKSILDGSRVFHTFTSSGVYSVTISGTSTQGTAGSKTVDILVLKNIYPKESIYLDSVLAKPENGEEEWISISGSATSSVDLTGWKISTETGKSFMIPIKTVFKPFTTLRFYKSVTKLTLNDTAGTVYLTNSNNEIVDALTYNKPKRGEASASQVEILQNTSEFVTSTAQDFEQPVKLAADKTKSYQAGYSLHEARGLPVNKFATLSGQVVSLPNKPYSNYFYIMDDTGGIQIYSYKKIFPALNLGDRISVSGQISSASGAPRLKISSPTQIKIISAKQNIVIEKKSIDEIDENDYGKIISLRGEITDVLSTSFFVDDSLGEAVVGIAAGAELNKKILGTGKEVEVVGIVETTKNGWKIIPRSAADVVLLSKPTEVVHGRVSNTAKTATGVGGGVFLIGLAAAVKKWLLTK